LLAENQNQRYHTQANPTGEATSNETDKGNVLNSIASSPDDCLALLRNVRRTRGRVPAPVFRVADEAIENRKTLLIEPVETRKK
jgi:hypothetical protein